MSGESSSTTMKTRRSRIAPEDRFANHRLPLYAHYAAATKSSSSISECHTIGMTRFACSYFHLSLILCACSFDDASSCTYRNSPLGDTANFTIVTAG